VAKDSGGGGGDDDDDDDDDSHCGWHVALHGSINQSISQYRLMRLKID